MRCVSSSAAAAALVCVLGLASAKDANAQSIIKNPGDHPNYSVELEPHLLLGWANLYRDNGLGIGGRFTIPIVDNGFIKSINNSVGITFGLDWLRYSGCYYRGGGKFADVGCGASFLIFPVAMQWNFWLTPHWSVFAEPGLYVFHGIYDDYCNNGLPGCGYPTRTSVQPAFYIGGRYHFNEKVSLTLRLGYPTLSFGVSFFL